MNITLIIIFSSCMAFIFLYSLVQLNLVINYRRSKLFNKIPIPKVIDWPQVTVQLPVYNEYYVIEALIDKICEFDYPTDKLEIQILDDSTDETIELISSKVKYYQTLGFDIQHIRRINRKGYKAGALAYGTSFCKGEFIAIFDADFKPKASFLKETIPYFKNSKIGVVQTKWGYTNADYSYLTQLQEFGLNAHFTIEQVGRNVKNHFINFNGTAGVWRKTCIADAGGWASDTLTEDLDLSYRAQLNQWQFKYLEDVISPSELPVEINALKSQQYRWTKGAAECFSKNFKRVLYSKHVKFTTKIHALFHLLNSSVFLLILAMSLLSLPVIIAKSNIGSHFLINLGGVFMISWLILGFFYYTAFKQYSNKSINSFLLNFFSFLAVSMGLSLHNSIAVIEGIIGIKTPFIRTPKFNISNENQKWESNIYRIKKISTVTYFEGALLIYFIITLQTAIAYHDYAMIPFLIFLIYGYGFVFINSIIHINKASKKSVIYEKAV